MVLIEAGEESGSPDLPAYIEHLAERWLHMFNVPAATDVRRLREQLSRLERQVERMANDLADRTEPAGEPPPRPAPKRAGPARVR